jgi:hypothetical protein
MSSKGMFVFSAKPVEFCVGVVLPHPSRVSMLLSGLKYIPFKEGLVHAQWVTVKSPSGEHPYSVVDVFIIPASHDRMS